MRSTAQALGQVVSAEHGRAALFAELFKARLTSLVLVTTLIGFYMGSPGTIDYFALFNALLGTALVAGAGAALNEVIEREYDARMRRTRSRPLPAGRMKPGTATAIGIGCAVAGIAWLGCLVNLLSMAVAAATLVLYVGVYTPLKRITWMNTMVGAIPGALPPLIGWTAARGDWGIEGVALFAIQAIWQIPHFMAIAWLYSEEYGNAGFKMLAVVDQTGARTGRHALVSAALLTIVSGLPWWLGQAGTVYLLGAVVMGGAFSWCAWRFAREASVLKARVLFYASIIYLPALLSLMVLDKTS